MADAMQASCAAPVFKRPRLEFSPCESETLISYESVSSEERFSVDSGVQEDPYEVTSSSDCPTDHLDEGTSLASGFNASDSNSVHIPTISGSQPLAFPNDQNDFVIDNSTNMFGHEACNQSEMVPPGRESEDNDLEDQDSINQESWIQKQKNCGMDPRMILGEILPKGTLIPPNVNDGLLWRYIINMLNEPKRSKLTDINTLDDAVNLLRTCKNIVVLTGAGVSVSCGIPDFRSRNGIYARLSKDYPDLPDPQAMFDIVYFRRDPRPFFKFAKEIYPGQFQPSPSHRFIKLLEKQGKLLRNYSQNIDTLEHAAGIKNVITCHGSFATATCTRCRYKVDSSVIKEDIFNQTIPYCPVCPAELGERGIMKPDIVFFGEGLSDEFHECLNDDKQVCDLLIVIGSSLKVRPVAMIPSSIPNHVPQILINREPLKHLTFDIELLGDCDVIIGELCRRLKSEWDLGDDIPGTPLKEVNVNSSSKDNVHALSDFASLDSTDFGEINNNFEFTQGQTNGGPSSLSQSEESNSCDYHGLSAIKLDDSEDGSNQGQLFPDSTNQEAVPKLDDIYNASSWTDNIKDPFNRKLPDHSYLFIPPNRYIFQGAEVYREDDDDCCSTSTDYSSDSDSPQRPPSDDGVGDLNSGLSLQSQYNIPTQSDSDQSCPVGECGVNSKHSNESPNT
ncbi:NAD-dependent protein deacetylase sirtuin-1 like protein [Argiope bruennichi]|uniref:protein acetyllysine N-acetyltransferase n=1 Tax=Argiope bruennichi TaxID=94029 RepID=A0A8T0EX05_ARGBR|nr:NAD-dependent protein deacetylase sirtuin-1 like protein [Argiope bruennichi]